MIDQLLPPRRAAEMEGCSLTSIYERLANGEYDAIKDGKKTLITTASIARRRERLPKAQFGVRRGIRGIPPKAEASA